MITAITYCLLTWIFYKDGNLFPPLVVPCVLFSIFLDLRILMWKGW